MDAEINHLLKYIEDSGCKLNRNGTNHDSRDTSKHIRKKYAYVKRRIRSTEDFIRYAVTESSMSVQPYTVICEGVEKPTAEWLADELARFGENIQCKANPWQFAAQPTKLRSAPWVVL